MGPKGSSPLRRLRGMRLLAQLSSGEKGSMSGRQAQLLSRTSGWKGRAHPWGS